MEIDACAIEKRASPELLHEDRNPRRLTLAHERTNPLNVARAGTRARLSADDYLTKISQPLSLLDLPTEEWFQINLTEQRLEADKGRCRAKLREGVKARDLGLVLDGHPDPDVAGPMPPLPDGWDEVQQGLGALGQKQPIKGRRASNRLPEQRAQPGEISSQPHQGLKV